MEQKIRILGIAPYEGLATMMNALVSDYPEIELKTYVGDLEKGLDIANKVFRENYDIIISRGGTAELIANAGMPVIEIEISSYDILCALKLADGMRGHTAIFSYADITSTANQIKRLLDYDTDIYTVDPSRSIEEQLEELKNKKYRAILCDMVTDTIARRIGINSHLITSGEKSIRRAFTQSAMLFSNTKKIYAENKLLNKLVYDGTNYFIVFDKDDNCIFSSMTNPSDALMSFLISENYETRKTKGPRKIFKELEDLRYSIKAEAFSLDGRALVAYIFSISKPPVPLGKMGIHFSQRAEAEALFSHSVLSYSNMLGPISKDIERINRSENPVMIIGEDGTGKESVANLIYLNSRHVNNPLITIDCRLLNEKSLAQITESDTTPLSGRKNTIYFSNIDVLDKKQEQQLLSSILEMNVAKRNRVIFSCTCTFGESISETGRNFADRLCCTSIYLTPLREMKDNFPELISQYLSHRSNNSINRIVGVESAAMELLKEFPWPHNMTQFNRVMTELELECTDQFINPEMVKKVLSKERYTGSTNLKLDENAQPIDLSRTLEEINIDIIKRVLAENNGSQTTTAKQLGIGRTTLWRYLSKDI